LFAFFFLVLKKNVFLRRSKKYFKQQQTERHWDLTEDQTQVPNAPGRASDHSRANALGITISDPMNFRVLNSRNSLPSTSTSTANFSTAESTLGIESKFVQNQENKKPISITKAGKPVEPPNF